MTRTKKSDIIYVLNLCNRFIANDSDKLKLSSWGNCYHITRNDNSIILGGQTLKGCYDFGWALFRVLEH